ncbi:hypothetical protein [Niabella ginsengisoli]|uniref:Uncharacterized protein n=1 Tax=Niabella ginsengisoli TaxID=522298 RepID=A0ABS9SEC1_9BACT|nr:hypothetical protein [Niabella ginsengisoli]MCH5596695.1 hypothetical protein [Niabella ginsengisoli]
MAVPPNAETEPGFTHWVHKLGDVAKEAGMKVSFFGTEQTLAAIEIVSERHKDIIPITYTRFDAWEDFLIFTRELAANDLFIIVSSRKGYNSYIELLNKLPYYLSRYFTRHSYIILYPEQLDTSINMADIQQADGKLIETISEQFGAINEAGKRIRKKFWKK